MILQGDCLIKLKELEDSSIDSIVTDPPYELGFMGKSWDNTGIAYNVGMWAECLRVLKPGGHLLAFSGTRTYHRMTVAIEDAGFEIRDMVEWVYGSGFPKSLNISKAIDKKPKANKVTGFKLWLKEQIDHCDKTKAQIDDECGFTACSYTKTDGKDYWSTNLPKDGKWDVMKKVIGIESNEYDWVAEDNTDARGYVEPTGGLHGGSGNTVGQFTGKQLANNPIDDNAKKWEGWGTALKPAHEPICLARKPIEGTVANNVLKYGTGGLNIDKSRVGTTTEIHSNGKRSMYGGNALLESKTHNSETEVKDYGRFPANLLHDGSDEVVREFPNTKSTVRNGGSGGSGLYQGKFGDGAVGGFKDSGSAARFFKSFIYCPKASKSERDRGCEGMEEVGGKAGEITVRGNTNPVCQICGGSKIDRGNGVCGCDNPEYKAVNNKMRNNHPTVKPLVLMKYLIQMITPEGGVVLDPFAGSGSTLVAAKELGYDFIGIEMTEEYIPIIEARLNAVKEERQQVLL